MSLLERDFNSRRAALAHDMLFATSGLYIAPKVEGGFTLQAEKHVIPSLLVASLVELDSEPVRSIPNEARELWYVPVVSDLHKRNVIDFILQDAGREKMTRETDNVRLVDANRVFLNTVFSQFESGFNSKLTNRYISKLAYVSFLQLPTSITIAEGTKHLHPSTFRTHAKRFLPGANADFVRDGINLLMNVANYTPSKADQISIRRMQDGRQSGASDTVDKFLDGLQHNSVEWSVDKRAKFSALSRYLLSVNATKMLGLFHLSPEEKDDMKHRFIEASYDVIYKAGYREALSEALFGVYIPEGVDIHILKGDERGGGHHIPSLDAKYCQLTTEPVEVEVNNVKIPYAKIMHLRDKSGDFDGPRVDSFFPSEWTAEEVLRRIQYPDRILGMSKSGDSVRQICVSGGVIFIRVTVHDEDLEIDELITAYPVTDEIIARAIN